MQLSFCFADAAWFLEELYERYLGDPNAVDAEWRTFFEALGEQKGDVLAEVRGASWAPNGAHVIGAVDPDSLPSPANRNVKGNAAAAPAAIAGKTEADIRAAAYDTSRAFLLIRSYRIRGHLEADLDPLGLVRHSLHRELDPATYGFGEGDWDRPILIFGTLGLGESATLRQIWDRLRKTYCGKIGVEYMHISDPDQKAWIQERIEHVENRTEFTPEGRRMILERVVEAEGLERYLGVKFVGTKRFGLDGGESMIPGIEQILKRGGQLGIRDVVIGMPHRGRLNTLVHVLHKSYTALFSEFQGRSSQPEEMRGSGDVPSRRPAVQFDGTTVHVSLSPNLASRSRRSRVLGKARASRTSAATASTARSWPSDARRRLRRPGLVAGVSISRISAATASGGTVHFIVNNQIGFHPADLSRSATHGGRQDRAGADPARERRRSRGRGPCRASPPSSASASARHRHRRCSRYQRPQQVDEPMFAAADVQEIAGHKSVKEVYTTRPGRGAPLRVTTFDRRCARSSTRRWKRRPSEAQQGRLAGGPLGRVHGRRARKIWGHRRQLEQRCGAAPFPSAQNFDANRKIARLLREAGPSRPARISTGRPAKRWPGALLAEGRVRLSGQIPAAAPSRSAMPCWSTRPPEVRAAQPRGGAGASGASTAR